MGPIDIKYHVVSLVAVFLALGVGIIVGGNTNLVGTNTLIEKQDGMIRRVENGMKNLQGELHDTRVALKASEDHVTLLEHETVPALLEGKLAGVRLGTVIVGTLPGDVTESVVLGPVKKSGALVQFKMKLPLERLEQEAGDPPDAVLKRLAAELLFGSTHGSEMTRRFAAEGLLLFGDFTMPVRGVVFIIGADVDPGRAARLLAPLEGYIRANRGVVVNALFERNAPVENALRRPNLPVFPEARGLVNQASLIAEVSSELLERAAARGF